jgi:hypothetical protein
VVVLRLDPVQPAVAANMISGAGIVDTGSTAHF